MKNLVVKISSLFVLAIILAVVSVQAQTIGSYKAHIPFDFTIGNKTYEAGDYTIRIKSPNYLATILTVTDAKSRELQASAIMKNGNSSHSNKTNLIFNRYGDQCVLKQIVSRDFGFSAPRSKVAKQLAKKSGKPDETLAIVLVNGNENIN